MSQPGLAWYHFQGWGRTKDRPACLRFIVQQEDGTVAAEIVDPHGIHFGDVMPKLKALAQYAERSGDQYCWIQAVAKIGDKFRVSALQSLPRQLSRLSIKVWMRPITCPMHHGVGRQFPAPWIWLPQRLRMICDPGPFAIRALIGLTGPRG